jgi:putative Mg2+ transporter-C (MgtC) family protein
MNDQDLQFAVRIVTTFGLSYVIGFERELRGAVAGDRTYALVGTAAAAMTAVTFASAPQAISGVITGIGFIGAGMILREGGGSLKGVTSAASVFAVTAVGVVAGSGHLLLAVLMALLVLLDLEIRHLPLLWRADARRYATAVRDDQEPPRGMGSAEPAG